MQSTSYYLGFNLVNGIGPARLERLIDYFGSVEAAWLAQPADLMAAGLDAKLARALVNARQTLDLDAEMERAERLDIQLISCEDPAYPTLLRQIPLAPPLLYVRGQIGDVDAWSVGVVGTRAPSPYGREAARRLSGDLASAGVTIVSGLALGIDAIAHAAALDAGGRTIAVLACGVDLIYPERHIALAERICAAGAMVSEFPLGTRPIPQLFPVRNRLISGLSSGVLVVEAGQKSGALITVDYALEQGRDVFAVPGQIYMHTSDGTNQAIRNGAGLVTCAQDILEALNFSSAAIQREVQAAFPDGPTETALMDLVSYAPQHVDELRRSMNLPIAEVMAALTVLELKGLVRQSGVMHYVLAR